MSTVSAFSIFNRFKNVVRMTKKYLGVSNIIMKENLNESLLFLKYNLQIGKINFNLWYYLECFYFEDFVLNFIITTYKLF